MITPHDKLIETIALMDKYYPLAIVVVVLALTWAAIRYIRNAY